MALRRRPRRADGRRIGLPRPQRACAVPAHFIHAGWITLHDSAAFRDRVGFLRRELDRVGPGEADLCADLFARTVALEGAYFDAAYAPD